MTQKTYSTHDILEEKRGRKMERIAFTAQGNASNKLSPTRLLFICSITSQYTIQEMTKPSTHVTSLLAYIKYSNSS